MNSIKIPIFLVGLLITGLVGYGNLRGQVTGNTAKIEDLKRTPTKIATIENEIKHISEDMKEFRMEQRVLMDRVLKAVE